jgi:DNA ligase-1
MLSRFKELVDSLQNNSSRLVKEDLIKQIEGDTLCTSLLHFIFNPYIVTGVSKKKADKYKGKISIDKFSLFDLLEEPKDYKDIEGMLEYFKQHNTGKDEDLIELEKYAQHNAPYQDLVYSIISKDLKLGVQATTLNKVLGQGFVPTFDVMLAQKYYDDPDKLVPDGTEFILTEKLDGIRCLLVVDEDGVKLFSRQGQQLFGLHQIEQSARLLLQSGFVYDGELIADNPNNLPSKDLYRKTMTIVSSDCDNKEGVYFHIFDKLAIQEFQAGYSGIDAYARKWALHSESSVFQIEGSYLKFVDILYSGTDKTEIEKWLHTITSKGGEGVMINISNAPYECKRTKGLLKVKQFHTADVRVIALEPGTGKNYNKLGALRVEFIGPDDKVYTCSVGSGLTDEDRERFWNSPELICDKIIEIGYFEISENQNGTYGLRFPTYKWIREDKTEISMN